MKNQTSLPFGLRGHYGTYRNPDDNGKVIKANLLIDRYNTKINTLNTLEEQFRLMVKISIKINKLIG